MFRIKIIKTLKEFNQLPQNLPTFFDTETGGLYVDIRLLQYYIPQYDANTVYIYDTDILPLEEALNDLRNRHIVAWNASYDIGTCQVAPKKVDDLQIAYRSAYPSTDRATLDIAVKKLLREDFYGGLNKKELQKAKFKKGVKLTKEQLQYAAIDVYVLAKIYEDQKIQKELSMPYYRLDMKLLRYLPIIQDNKLYIDRDKAFKEINKLHSRINELQSKLGDLNVNSPKQVTQFFGISSSDKDTLIRLKDTEPLAWVVLELRHAKKRLQMLESYTENPKGWVETRFNVAGAVTGRFSATKGDLKYGINAQQIPREYQYLFLQPKDKTVVVHADYSTAELRAGCSIMAEKNMYKLFKDNIDVHKMSATLAFPKDINKVTKEERQRGKAISFGLIFGMGAERFKNYAYTEYGVTFTETEAERIRNRYFDTYPNIRNYQLRWWEKWETTPAMTAMGRKSLAHTGNNAINFPTQGSVAEITKLASVLLFNTGFGKCIFNIVHDAIYLRVPYHLAEDASDALAKCMKDAWFYALGKFPLFKFKDVPMPVEVEYIDLDGKNIIKEYE